MGEEELDMLWPSQGIEGLRRLFETWRLNDFGESVREELSKYVEPHTASIQFIRVSKKSMLCVLTLSNGYDIRGEAACVNPDHFDNEIGAKYSLRDACRQAARVIAYKEQDKLAAGETPEYDD